MRRGRGRSLHLMRGRSCPTKEGYRMDIVHALGDDKRTCKACGEAFPCAGWKEQARDIDPMVRPETLATYADAQPPVIERLHNWTKEMG